MSTESRDTRGLLGKLFGKGTVALLLAVFLINGTAWAYSVHGPGGVSCGEWTAEKENNASGQEFHYRQLFQSWLLGYLTAYSRWVEPKTEGPVSEIRGPAAFAWIDNYCQETPLDSVAKAVEKLILALKAR